MIVENMRNYLWKLSDSIGTERASKEPLYLGHHIPDKNVYFFAGGGPGYVLNRVTVKRLVREVFPVCEVDTATHAEDRYVGGCLRKTIEIFVNDTADERGKQRFHGLDPFWVAKFDGTNDRYYSRIYKMW